MVTKICGAAAHLWVAVICLGNLTVRGAEAQQVPAMFIFGDSLVDVGNNNYLNSIARANYLPYGCDTSAGPTGRFTNAKTSVDILGDFLGVPSPPSFADPSAVGDRILRGVNYASAAAGILDETGQHYGDRFPLNQQVLNFQKTLTQLTPLIGATNMTQYLSKSIAMVVIGSNDYINNYFLPSLYSSSRTSAPPQYADLLLRRYARHLLSLHALGLRKFFLAGVGPLGCIPFRRASAPAPPGRCVDSDNRAVGFFNDGLRSLVAQLNAGRPGATFVFGNTYGAVGDMLNNPASYGFSVIDRGCCGTSLGSEITCLPFSVPCADRGEFLFWDAFHPTEAVTGVLARRAFSGPPEDCYPINLRQMALI